MTLAEAPGQILRGGIAEGGNLGGISPSSGDQNTALPPSHLPPYGTAGRGAFRGIISSRLAM